MPKLARLDIPNVLRHVIIRGIEHRRISTDSNDQDRGLFCYWAVRELGLYYAVETAVRLGMSQLGVVYAVRRGEHIATERGC